MVKKSGMPKLITHIPHSSTAIPASINDKFLLSQDDLLRQMILMTDAFTDELFSGYVSANSVVASVSRLVVDVERFRNDADEVMSSRGMGAIYLSTTDGRRLRAPLPAEERERWLRKWYDPHHAALFEAVRDGLKQRGRVLIIDGHSFPSVPRPYELDQNPIRPDICLGCDAFHTPAALVEEAQAYFERLGFSVAVNRPFSGSIVPQAHYLKTPEVFSLMIEVNRRLYMDERSGAKHGAFSEIRRVMGDFLSTVTNFAY